MSTILQAQQKSKQEQAGGPAPIVQQQKKISPWKVILSLALATIITLLSILIYLQLTPRPEAMPIVASSNEPQPQQQQQSHSLQKVTFETQPLAIIDPKPKKVVTPPQQRQPPLMKNNTLFHRRIINTKKRYLLASLTIKRPITHRPLKHLKGALTSLY